jgi:hypothetical protein
VRLVNDWGVIVRMSERNFVKWLKLGASGDIQSADKFGKVIGSLSISTVDLDPEDFKFRLECLK